MKDSMTKKLVLAGLFIALGIILPIAFHTIEGAGSVFLPMHIPVLISGFFLDWPFALAVGMLTPLLSSTITGMPPVFPAMVFMIFELATYGVIVSLFYRKLEKNTYVSLISSMICGRLVSGFVVWILGTFFAAQLPGPILFIKGAIVKGIPGIIIQLILIPIIIMAIEKSNLNSELNENR